MMGGGTAAAGLLVTGREMEVKIHHLNMLIKAKLVDLFFLKLFLVLLLKCTLASLGPCTYLDVQIMPMFKNK